MSNSEITYYLIKRSPKLTDKGFIAKKNNLKKEYSESRIDGNPPSVNLKNGDIIYVAETNYGIYAKCQFFKKWDEPVVFNTIENIFSYFAQKNDIVYCFELMKKLKGAKDKNSKKRLFYHEYVVDQVILDNVIPLEGELEILKNRTGFTEIKNKKLIHHIENPRPTLNFKIDKSIPNSLRLKLYSFFSKRHNISTIIDIDHFVPKIVGGPGNIIENLIPMGFSLNRYKGHSIPKGLFKVSLDYPELKNHVDVEHMSDDDEMFLRSKRAQEDARLIVSIVNSWSGGDGLLRIKNFYGAILKYHNPEYFDLIKDVNIDRA